MSYENPYFERGKTHFEGAPDNATDGEHILGQTYRYRSDYDGRTVLLRTVRNGSGIDIPGKRMVQLNAAGDTITGFAKSNVTGKAYCVDDQLSEVAANDICYVCVGGPQITKTSDADYSADISAGDELMAHTDAAASTAATTEGVGRIGPAFAGTTLTQIEANRKSVLGRAISGVSTNDTDTDILVDFYNLES